MKTAKAPDLNAPRFRRKVLNTLDRKSIREIKKEVPEIKNVSDDDIRRIVQGFNKHICKTVIDYRDGVELPEQIGHLFIGSCRPMKSNVDFKSSTTYLKKIQHRNWESDAYVAKIFYTVSRMFYADHKWNKYNFRNHELWGFNGSREFTRTVGAVYPTYWKRYVEVDPTKKIIHVYKTNTAAIRETRNNEKILQVYNPFEL